MPKEIKRTHYISFLITLLIRAHSNTYIYFSVLKDISINDKIII